MTSNIPDDFPCENLWGAVAGAQAKLLVRRTDDGAYVGGETEEEHQKRYQYCRDLVQQLVGYCRRKADEHPDWTCEMITGRMAQGLARKAWGWGLSSAEQDWIVEETRKGFQFESIPGNS